jgi:hypothetical protein
MIYPKQLQNVEYFNHFGSLITNDERCTLEIKSMIAISTAARNKLKLFTSKLNLNLGMKLALCGAETWTLRRTDQKYLESLETWCWKRMTEKIDWTDRGKNDVLHAHIHEGKEHSTYKETKKG